MVGVKINTSGVEQLFTPDILIQYNCQYLYEDIKNMWCAPRCLIVCDKHPKWMVKKAIASMEKYDNEVHILLPASTDSTYFQELLKKASNITFFQGRFSILNTPERAWCLVELG